MLRDRAFSVTARVRRSKGMSRSLPTIPKAPPTRIVRFGRRIQRGVASFAERMSPPPFALLDLVMSRWVGDALAAIARLGVAETLADGPRDVASLAGKVGLHEASLYRVLRALARKGDEPGQTTVLVRTLTELAPVRRDRLIRAEPTRPSA